MLYPTRGISERGHICSAHRLYIYIFFFIGGEVHARMRCRSSNKHRARHAATSQILHSRNRFPKNMSALTQNYAVHTLFHIEIALQGATSIPAAHPTPSAVNNSDFPSTSQLSKRTAPFRRIPNCFAHFAPLAFPRSAYLPRRVNASVRVSFLMLTPAQLLRIAGRWRAGRKETDRAAVLSPRIGWRLVTVSSGWGR